MLPIGHFPREFYICKVLRHPHDPFIDNFPPAPFFSEDVPPTRGAEAATDIRSGYDGFVQIRGETYVRQRNGSAGSRECLLKVSHTSSISQDCVVEEPLRQTASQMFGWSIHSYERTCRNRENDPVPDRHSGRRSTGPRDRP